MPDAADLGELSAAAVAAARSGEDVEAYAEESRRTSVRVRGGEVAVASAWGGPLEYARTDVWASVVCLAERDGETHTGYAFRLGRETEDLLWAEAAEEAAVRAARLLGAAKPRSERLPVVFDP